jgi:hypothetical protein
LPAAIDGCERTIIAIIAQLRPAGSYRTVSNEPFPAGGVAEPRAGDRPSSRRPTFEPAIEPTASGGARDQRIS